MNMMKFMNFTGIILVKKIMKETGKSGKCNKVIKKREELQICGSSILMERKSKGKLETLCFDCKIDPSY